MGVDYDTSSYYTYGNPVAVPDVEPEPSAETVDYYERLSAEQEAAATPSPMSAAARQAEIDAIRSDPRLHSKDGTVRGPIVDRLNALLSDEPVYDQPPEVVKEMTRGADPMTQAEVQLRSHWGESTEQRLTEINDWVDALDAKLGNQQATNALWSLGIHNDPLLARIVSAGLRGEPYVKISGDDAKRLIAKLNNHKVMQASPMMKEIMQGALDQLYGVAYPNQPTN